MPEPRTLVWFRADLRVADNPALHTAAKRGPVVGLFLLAYEQWREHDWGHNRLRFLLDHLSALSHRLAELGIPLRVRTCDRFADAAQAVLRAARDEGCDAVYCNREYEWNERQRDRGVAELLRHNGIEIAGFDDQVLLRPGTVQTGAGGFFTVFTPFRKACLKLLADGLPQPLPEPAAQGPSIEPTALPESPPDFPGADADLSRFPGGEDAAHARLEAFVAEQQVDYAARRDFPGIDGTSGLSPYLACGAISARQCFDVGAAREPFDDSTFLTEILWREFYRHVVF
ncbi:MAG: deoxyribodipyrimidine photo-lyase, partial [Planctomycetes bacterium]|nr:deoxyribodipyrimidine photo-lyase [Planctomycetota bacterium]